MISLEETLIQRKRIRDLLEEYHEHDLINILGMEDDSMASKEYTQRKEELKELVGEVIQIAYAKASPILREALDNYSKRIDELLKPKKRGG